MLNKKQDLTIKKKYKNNWLFLINEYKKVKEKKHDKFKTLNELFLTHNLPRQTFYKYYNRFKQSKSAEDLFPQKRGPKWCSRRPDLSIETEVIKERLKGLNKYEIYNILLPKFGDKMPSLTGIYNIFKRYNMNRLNLKQQEEKRKIIKERSGELGHVDCHYLSKDLISGEYKRYYLLTIIDSYSRLAWTEVIDNIKSLTVMFTALKSINFLNMSYGLKFEEMLSDNGSEFSSRTEESRKDHPFERMLEELDIKHRYTRPCRPQTNGKVERFWRTLNSDLIKGTTFGSLQEFRTELQKYMFYYNEHRPHQGLSGSTPKDFHEKNLSPN